MGCMSETNSVYILKGNKKKKKKKEKRRRKKEKDL
jgi:hypothetical protein